MVEERLGQIEDRLGHGFKECRASEDDLNKRADSIEKRADSIERRMLTQKHLSLQNLDATRQPHSSAAHQLEYLSEQNDLHKKQIDELQKQMAQMSRPPPVG